MDARLTEEQELIRRTAEEVARSLAPGSPDDLVAIRDRHDDGSASWKKLAEVGLLGIRLPAAIGGMALTGVEVALVAEQLGRFCVPLPFLAAATWTSELLRGARAGDDLLAAIASGDVRLAPALSAKLRTLAEPGTPGVAFDTRGASGGLVLEGARLKVVALGDSLESQDLTRELRRIDADAAEVSIGDLGGALPQEAQTRALALVLATLAADLVGTMHAALDRAVAYADDREQFGVKIATFQAVQHMAAEALVSVEASRGLAMYAAWAVDALSPNEALDAARTAKAYASEHAKQVCETAIQIHGGIGMTWEAMPHVSLRRALSSRLVLGNEHVQYQHLAKTRFGEAQG